MTMGCGLKRYAAAASVVSAIVDSVGCALMITLTPVGHRRLWYLAFVNCTNYALGTLLAAVAVFTWMPATARRAFFVDSAASLREGVICSNESENDSAGRRRKYTNDVVEAEESLVAQLLHNRYHGGEGYGATARDGDEQMMTEDGGGSIDDEDARDDRADNGDSTSITMALLSNFLQDGLSMTIRSLLLQLSFLVSSAVAATLGMHVLAAHQIVVQLWLITSYTVDAFAIAGNCIGANLAALRLGQPDRSGSRSSDLDDASIRDHNDCVRGLLRTLTFRLLVMGSAVGCGACLLMGLLKDDIIDIFTSDPAVSSRLRAVWPILAAAQPVNSLVFVYDGLLLASASYAFMRNMMAFGFCLVFVPTISLQCVYASPSLSAIWLSKFALNVERLIAAAWRIHCGWLRE